MNETVSIDGFGPLEIRKPQSVDELGEWIRQARSRNEAIYPLGGRTHLDLGMPPKKAGFAVDLTALSQIQDYPARDMTITVQAGITIAALQAELAKEGQWLPIDIPHPEKATLGGSLAVNASGPRRFGNGTLRDYVIGIRFLTDAGVEVKGGGQVVKNVAGYDLMKLQIGALGTLGIITQVTLKVRPKPESFAAVCFPAPADKLSALLESLHQSKSRPIAVDVSNHRAPSEWMVSVGFEEKAVSVAWQVQTLREDLKLCSIEDARELRDSSALAHWQELTDLQIRPASQYIWKASTLPSKTAKLLGKLGPSADRMVHAHALNGIVWVHSDREPFPESSVETVVCRRAPAAWKTESRVWHEPRSDRKLMQKIKNTLDPDGVFNPGRMF